jgi:integrase
MARRRGQNEGSIFQRKDGRWCAILSLGWENGSRKRKSFYGKTAAEVQNQLLKARSDHAHNIPVAIERQSVGQFLMHWLEHTIKPNARPRSYESFEIIIRRHIIPELGQVRLEKLSPQNVQGLLDRKLRGGLAPQTVVHIRMVLRTALNQAMKWSLIARNPAALVDPPRMPRGEIRPLTAEEARRFLDAAKGERLEALYTLALFSGLRRGEILGLRWSDVDLEERALRVNQAIQRVGGKLRAAETKTERSRRTISLPSTIVAVLRAHRVHQLQERLIAGSLWQDSGLVFMSRVGTPVEPRNLHRDFVRVLKVAKVPRIRFHDLRHSAASLLLAQGVPLRMIMEQLGHSSIALTANTYAHVMPAAMRDVADKMELILGAGRMRTL